MIHELNEKLKTPLSPIRMTKNPYKTKIDFLIQVKDSSDGC